MAVGYADRAGGYLECADIGQVLKEIELLLNDVPLGHEIRVTVSRVSTGLAIDYAYIKSE